MLYVMRNNQDFGPYDEQTLKTYVDTILSGQWTKDKALIVLAFVGLLPSVLMFLPLGNLGTFIFLIWDMLGLPDLNPAYLLTDAGFPLNLIGYIFGVGVTEEFAKLLPLLIIVAMAKKPVIPQTLVYYGLMCGIAFGVILLTTYLKQGVNYQSKLRK